MTELETEILFLRQALVARRIQATLAAPRPAPETYRGALLAVPSGNGRRGSLRDVGIASCPLAPDSKITTRGKRSHEGIARQEIAANEREIVRLREGIEFGIL